MSAPAALVVVLHAHLPWVRHPEHAQHLEERWFFEALGECYLPLLDAWERLAEDGVPFRVTVSVSPTLLTMLEDPLLTERAVAHLERTLALAQAETQRFGGARPWGEVAGWYRERFAGLVERVRRPAGHDVVGRLRALAEAGNVELLTCAATHAVLPLLVDEPGTLHAEVQVACAEHARRFGSAPEGFWLPECGYSPDLDEVLVGQGVRFTFVETHGLLYGKPAPVGGGWLPVTTPNGLAVFGRDPESSKQIWSAREGYPGDSVYREFHRDIGHERELDYIAPWILPDGLRVDTGLKYWRVTGGEGEKAPWEPEAAWARAAEHAADFASHRAERALALADELGRPPVFTVPLDAELLGHWWFEGPVFLESLFRTLAAQPERLVARRPSEVLDAGWPLQEVQPATSSWGEGGYFGVWVDPANDWLVRHLAEVRRRLAEVVIPTGCGPLRASERIGRASRQAAREALLAHASDWPFILKTGTATGYARARIETHLRRALTLADMLAKASIDIDYVAALEEADPLFPELDLDAAFAPVVPDA